MILCKAFKYQYLILLLHVFVKPSNLYQRGPSSWKLNEEILNNNASLIREDLKNFYENESPSSYENFKHNFRDLLRFIQENKKRVDQKELNLLKYHENVLRDCIHSGKGPNPNLIEKYHLVLEHLQKVSKEKDFSDYRKIQKTLSYTFEGVPKFCSQWTSKNTINSIKRIQVDQNVYHTDEDILNQFRNYFSNIFSNSSTTDSDQLLKTFLSKNKLEKNENDGYNYFTEDEIHLAINKLNLKSSPGPDGLTSKLYKTFTDEFCSILAKVFNHFVHGGKFPNSFYLAIIKLIPKSENAIAVQDFRPISLMNTDAKIFAHVVCNQFKNDLCKVVKNHQHAYLPGRHMHTAIRKLKKAITPERLATRGSCAVKLDFSKAFDRVDRSLLIKILKALNLDELSVRAIETLYLDSKAVIEINGFLSASFKIHRGVRQGCPLSAFLFIVFIEPLLQAIESTEAIEGFGILCPKLVSYADDITCLIKIRCIDRLFRLIDTFCKQTQMMINISKSEVLSIPDLSPYKTVKETKILGVLFYTSQKIENIELLLSSQIQKHRGLISLSKSLRAKSLTLSVHVLPKFFHLARHTTVNLDTVSKCQELLNTELKKKTSRLDIRKEVLYHPILDGGIGLPCLQLKLFSMKIIDFFASDMSDQNSLLPTDSILPKEIKNVLRNTNISIEISSSDFAIFSNSTNSGLIITIQTKSRDVYYFCLQNCSFYRAVIFRLGFAANRYLCSEEELIKFTGKVWKNSMLDVWEKKLSL